MKQQTLKLTLKKKWFDEILSGVKTKEYREIKKYWLWRLFWNNEKTKFTDEIIKYMKDPYEKFSDVEELLYFYGLEKKEFDYIQFFNGGHFSDKLPNFKIELKDISIGIDTKDKYYFILKLGEILEKNNIL